MRLLDATRRSRQYLWPQIFAHNMGSYMGTLGPDYILFKYLDPQGKLHKSKIARMTLSTGQASACLRGLGFRALSFPNHV